MDENYNKNYYKKHRDYFRNYYREHKEHINASAKNWQAKSRERFKEINKKALRKRLTLLKEEVLTYYGGGKLACVKCSFDNIKALSIDHINGGGNQHRKKTKMSSSYGFYGWLKSYNYPEGYQTLCMNCQIIKRKVNKEFKHY